MFEVLERLLLGRSRIEKKWVKNAYKSGEGYCALGAIRNENHTEDRVFHECEDILSLKLNGRCSGVIFWFNDERERKKEEILTLYDKAIESEVERVGVSVEKLNI